MRVLGRNQLSLNHATLCAIVETWIRSNSISGTNMPQVTTCRYDASDASMIFTLDGGARLKEPQA